MYFLKVTQSLVAEALRLEDDEDTVETSQKTVYYEKTDGNAFFVI